MQLRILQSDNPDYPIGTVGNITAEYDQFNMIGWAVEVESRKTGKPVEIFVDKSAGEVLPDMSGTAEDAIFITAIEALKTRGVQPFDAIVQSLELSEPNLAGAFVALVHYARAKGMKLPQAVIALLKG